MAKKTNTQLQQFFQTGDIPSQQNYFDLIDSYINLKDETNTTSTFKLMDDNDFGILQTPVGRIIFGDTNLPIDIQSNVTASGYITAGNITASGDISASGTLFGGGLNINGTTTFNDGDITNVGTIDVDQVRADASILDFINLGTNNITTVINGTNTFVVKPKIIEIGTPGVNAHVTASGNISASGTVFANEFNIANISSSGTIVGTNFATNPFLNSKYYFNGDGGSNYLTAPSSTQVDLRMNGSQVVSFTNSSMVLSEINNYNLSVGGKITGKSSLTVSGNISSSGDLSITGSSFIGGHITASGNISASGDITIGGNISASKSLKVKNIRLAFGGSLIAEDVSEIGDTLLFNANPTQVNVGDPDVKTVINGDDILLSPGLTGTVLNISSSGNISASGDILTKGNIVANEVTASGNISLGFNKYLLGKKNNLITSDTVELIRNVGSTLAYFGSFDLDNSYLLGDNVNLDAFEGGIKFRRDSANKISFSLGSDQRMTVEGNFEVVSKGNKIKYTDSETSPFTIELNTETGLISGSLLKIDGSQVDFTNLPTSDPGVAGRLWQSGSTAGPDSAKFVVISQG